MLQNARIVSQKSKDRIFIKFCLQLRWWQGEFFRSDFFLKVHMKTGQRQLFLLYTSEKTSTSDSATFKSGLFWGPTITCGDCPNGEPNVFLAGLLLSVLGCRGNPGLLEDDGSCCCGNPENKFDPGLVLANLNPDCPFPNSCPNSKLFWGGFWGPSSPNAAPSFPPGPGEGLWARLFPNGLFWGIPRTPVGSWLGMDPKGLPNLGGLPWGCWRNPEFPPKLGAFWFWKPGNCLGSLGFCCCSENSSFSGVASNSFPWK